MARQLTLDNPPEQYNHAVDDMRSYEYPMLKGKCYLDHAGATLYPRSLIEEVSKDLLSNLYGNPHSDSTPSAVAGHRIDSIRLKTLKFFNANPEHFDLVFVANATAAIKLVMEGFRDYHSTGDDSSKGFWYGYHRDCHTSLVGIREVANGPRRCFQTDREVDNWIEGINDGKARLYRPHPGQVGLFAYPGQSNMTGRRLPLDWSGRIRRSHLGSSVYTLLDAAALATTAPLDLSDVSNAPDFTCLSFYKVFGFPDLGALIVRKPSGHVLQKRRAFFGGTVDMVIALSGNWHAKKDASLHDRLEDGTLPFHSIFALDAALNIHQRLFGNMKKISMHTAFLIKQIHDDMVSLRHYNGQPVCRIYNDAGAIYGDAKTQGATLAFNLLRADGSVIGYSDVEKLADEHGIYVRSGSLCNPGGFATYLAWPAADMRAAYDAGHRCSSPTQLVNGKPTGVVRVSLGAMSNLSDVKSLLRFIVANYVEATYEDAVLLEEAEIPAAFPRNFVLQSINITASHKVGNFDRISHQHKKQLEGKKPKRKTKVVSAILALRGKGELRQNS